MVSSRTGHKGRLDHSRVVPHAYRLRGLGLQSWAPSNTHHGRYYISFSATPTRATYGICYTMVQSHQCLQIALQHSRATNGELKLLEARHTQSFSLNMCEYVGMDSFHRHHCCAGHADRHCTCHTSWRPLSWGVVPNHPGGRHVAEPPLQW